MWVFYDFVTHNLYVHMYKIHKIVKFLKVKVISLKTAEKKITCLTTTEQCKVMPVIRVCFQNITLSFGKIAYRK